MAEPSPPPPTTPAPAPAGAGPRPGLSPAARELRSATRAMAAALARRDAAVVAMRKEGASLRQIAAEAGLTHPGVLRILRAQGCR
jgi:DNA-binding CsgD family transcriptional regulator